MAQAVTDCVESSRLFMLAEAERARNNTRHCPLAPLSSPQRLCVAITGSPRRGHITLQCVAALLSKMTALQCADTQIVMVGTYGRGISDANLITPVVTTINATPSTAMVEAFNNGTSELDSVPQRITYISALNACLETQSECVLAASIFFPLTPQVDPRPRGRRLPCEQLQSSN